MRLPTDPKERKDVPIATGFIDYFPDAIADVAVLSRIGNDQHHAGKPLHWDRAKSTDESDALMRHFLERGTLDTDGVRHSTKVAWRALALLQKEIEHDKRRSSKGDSSDAVDNRQLGLELTWRGDTPNQQCTGGLAAAGSRLGDGYPTLGGTY